MQRKLLCSTAALIMLLSFAPAVTQNYHFNYDYSYWNQAKPAPPAYYAKRSFTGHHWGLGDLTALADIYAYDGRYYVLDSAQPGLFIFDGSWRLVQTITGFYRNGRRETMDAPEAVAVSERGIVIADTGNRRLLRFTLDGEPIDVIEKPEVRSLEAVDFKASDLTVDKSGRIYVLIRGVYEGIVELNDDGSFNRFTGVNRVQFQLWDYLWKALATDAQRRQMQLFIPVTFSGIRTDARGFIYVVSPEENFEDPIKRINPKGADVLRTERPDMLFGDLNFRPIDEPRGGPTTFTAVTVNRYGVYSALDNTMGRIFTYNDGGELLYISGGYGEQKGLFRRAVALEYGDNDELIVLDAGNQMITVLAPTEYGLALNRATELVYYGDYAASEEWWLQVIGMNGNSEPAYNGLGKLALRRHDYRQALDYFRLGNNKTYYSKAFQRYRREMMRRHFPWVMAVVGIAVALLLFFSVRKSIWKES